jgi:hypothetical protein
MSAEVGVLSNRVVESSPRDFSQDFPEGKGRILPILTWMANLEGAPGKAGLRVSWIASLFASLLVVCAPEFGCATPPTPKPRTLAPLASTVSPSPRPRAAARQEMSLAGEMGVLEADDVEDTMRAHFDDIRSCYGRAGDAQRYAAGDVLLRFLVAGNGSAQDVWVIESSLGNYDVERCLVEVGRGITFRAPLGGKATTFEYPVSFRSTNQIPVREADALRIEHDLALFLPELATCGQLASDPANAILYVEPDGFPGSVGLSVAAAIDEKVGQCMVQAIRKWSMSARLPASVIRTTFTIPSVIATAEVAPRRRKSSHPRRH